METKRTARLLFLDPLDRLLLMKIDDPLSLDAQGHRNPPLWATIGGRLEGGESVLEAAAPGGGGGDRDHGH